MKHYLWCIALVLCVSGSAYANKGGNLSTRGLARIKAAVVESKFGRTAMAGLLGFQLICGGITGCGNGDSLVTPTETEIVAETKVVEATVQVIDYFDGDSIYFKLGGTIHEGRVVEGVSTDEVLVNLADGSEMVINIDRIAGTLIADHPDLGTRVVMLSEEEGESELIGKIARVYNDDMRKIKILATTFMNGTSKILDQPRTRFVHEDTDFENGGYLTTEEFAEWLDN